MPRLKARKLNITVPEGQRFALAAIIEMHAHERRTPSGAVSRSGNGEFSYVPEFREAMQSLADQLRDDA